MQDRQANTTILTALQEAARRYGELRWPLIPKLPGTNRDRFQGERLANALRTIEQVVAHWDKYPSDNIALLTGCGIVQVDVDRHPGGGDGSKAWQRLPLPPEGRTTETHETPNGTHYLYRYDGDLPTCELAPGLELLSRNATSLLPPSTRNGSEYTVVGKHPIRTLPQGVVDAVHQRQQAKERPSASTDDPILEGQRNRELASVAGRLRWAGLGPTEIEQHLQQVNLRRCQPPMPDSEVAAIARSVGRYSPGDSEPAENGHRKEPEKSAIRAVPLRDLLARDMPAREYLLKPLLQDRDVDMVHAFRGIGKSRFMHGLAVAIASAGNFLKYSAPAGRRVLLVDGELPREELQKMLAQAVNTAIDLPADPDIDILSADLAGESLPSLVTRAGQQIVEDHLRGGDVLILDAITTLCSGAGPENDSDSWEIMQQWLLALRRKGTTPLLVHHDGKGGSQRGTSRREDVLSQIVQLRRPTDYRPAQAARFEVHLTKARGITGDDAEPFEAQLTAEGTRLKWTWKKLKDVQAIQAKALKDEGLTQREIAGELKIRLATVNRALNR